RMASSDTEVVVVGGGAAGIAAGRRLVDAGIKCLVVEARPRLGGRSWTIGDGSQFPLDLGCGWLHSADRNPWREIAEAAGCTIDKTPPPWRRLSLPIGFPIAEQRGFLQALETFYERLGSLADGEPDRPAAAFLEPRGRWNNLIGAVGTYVNGAELDRVSARDFGRYDDSGVNYRVVGGYGTVIARHGAGLPVVLGCPVQRIDHSGRRLRVETADGTIAADAVIVTLPSGLLAAEELRFTPALHEKTEAAAALPLGLADKLFMSLAEADEFDKNSRLFGRTDRTETATYHLRPFGRPLIEAYFGGTLAARLEADGEGAFLDFAVAELVGLLGSDFARRVKLLHLHRWGADPFSRGSYSYALPGKADRRAALAAPVDDRLFFAGEACSEGDYSTAHGAYLTGIAAAEQAIVARRT
ncbi:MAG TPA: NAD(P)/FAD-dependent oxidoreductase, partial [Xanthobacteraceae bacterium]|nr:NAD(P)/FAD-dependent oxidoreductase [Xanthobacteraceae bacterium]